MTMPRFAAEASLYQTNNRYRFAAGGSSLSDGTTAVTPQGCGLSCAIATVGIGIVCGGACAFNPLTCAACVSLLLSADACIPCYDCLPKFIRDLLDQIPGGFCSRDGGGEPPCCPSGTICSCGGHCISGLCTGICLPPGAPCPPPP